METVIQFDGKAYSRCAWTGGDTPPRRYAAAAYRAIRRAYFRESVGICGGLDLWACAGTSALDRARIFWRAARLDAWATLRDHARRAAELASRAAEAYREGGRHCRRGDDTAGAEAYTAAAADFAAAGLPRKASRAAAWAQRCRNREEFKAIGDYARNYGAE